MQILARATLDSVVVESKYLDRVSKAISAQYVICAWGSYAGFVFYFQVWRGVNVL